MKRERTRPGVFREGRFSQCGPVIPECMGRAVKSPCTCPRWTREQRALIEKHRFSVEALDHLRDELVYKLSWPEDVASALAELRPRSARELPPPPPGLRVVGVVYLNERRRRNA